MKNKKNTLVIILLVIIAILCVIIGWLFGSRFADKENDIVNNVKPNTEEKDKYIILDKNSELVQFLYNGSRPLSFDVEGIYITEYLKSSDRAYENKLCLIMDQVKENTGSYSETKIKELYNKLNGVNSYNRLEKIDCPCATFNFDINNSEYYVVADGCGSVAGYDDVINEARKYDDRIEIITTYYFSGWVSNDAWRVCTDRNCNTVLVESNSMVEMDIFETYKDKLNRLIYTYELASDGNYYFVSTKISK